MVSVDVNPFTAPACNFSGLKEARKHAHSIYSGPLTHLLSMLCVLMQLVSHAGAEKEAKRLKGFILGTFIGRFQVTSWQ